MTYQSLSAETRESVWFLEVKLETKKTHCFNTWFQQKMSTDPQDDQRYGMVEAISHLVHRDYAEIGHLVGAHGMDGGNQWDWRSGMSDLQFI